LLRQIRASPLLRLSDSQTTIPFLELGKPILPALTKATD
jgi:hypothetical protein